MRTRHSPAYLASQMLSPSADAHAVAAARVAASILASIAFRSSAARHYPRANPIMPAIFHTFDRPLHCTKPNAGRNVTYADGSPYYDANGLRVTD